MKKGYEYYGDAFEHPTKLTKDYYIEGNLIKKGSSIFTENLTLNQIMQKDFYTGNKNDHLSYFYNIRKGMVGTGNTNIKLVTSELNDDGSADFLFSTVVTPDGTDKKELADAPIDSNSDGKLISNISDEYELTLRVGDFWNLLDYFNIEEQNDFTESNLRAIIDLSQDIKLSCSCASFWWMGASYYLTNNNASLIPCTIKPTHWNKIRPEVSVCKHLDALIRNLKFFEPMMAQSIKTNLIQQGFIDKKV